MFAPLNPRPKQEGRLTAAFLFKHCRVLKHSITLNRGNY
jgi:hypothetical protein